MKLYRCVVKGEKKKSIVLISANTKWVPKKTKGNLRIAYYDF